MHKLTYIWHDCFLLQWEAGSIVFDYWTMPGVRKGEYPPFLDSLDIDKPLYVVVSHHHKDHYTSDIFKWAVRIPKIHFILSADTASAARPYINSGSMYKGIKVDASKVTVLKAGDYVEFPGLRVEAFGSTDIGNSYLLNVGGKKVFHAGDLNAWLWKDESTAEEVSEALDSFLQIVETIREASASIDICMFPVDSRIGTDYYEGARRFVRRIDVKTFIPMHLALGDEQERRGRIADAMRFELYANSRRGQYIGLVSTGAAFSEV